MEAMQYNTATKSWEATTTTEQAWDEDRTSRDRRQLLTLDEYESLQKAAKRFYREETPEFAALVCQRNRLER